jgi:hypothetical protein
MGLTYARKDASVSSRWGMELGVQGGRDTEEFAFWWVKEESMGPMCGGTFMRKRLFLHRLAEA